MGYSQNTAVVAVFSPFMHPHTSHRAASSLLDVEHTVTQNRQFSKLCTTNFDVRSLAWAI
jgi:hypothetical protein